MKAQIMECTMSDQNSNMRWSLDWYYFRVPETLVKPFISWCKNVQNVAHRQPMGLPRNPHLNHLFIIIFSYFLVFSGVFVINTFRKHFTPPGDFAVPGHEYSDRQRYGGLAEVVCSSETRPFWGVRFFEVWLTDTSIFEDHVGDCSGFFSVY